MGFMSVLAPFVAAVETSGGEVSTETEVNSGDDMFKLFQKISGIDRVLSATETEAATDTETEIGVKFYRIIEAMYKTGQERLNIIVGESNKNVSIANNRNIKITEIEKKKKIMEGMKEKSTLTIGSVVKHIMQDFELLKKYIKEECDYLSGRDEKISNTRKCADFIDRAKHAQENPNQEYGGLSFSDPLSRLMAALVRSQEKNFDSTKNYERVYEEFQKYSSLFQGVVRDVESENVDPSKLMENSETQLLDCLFNNIYKKINDVIVIAQKNRIFITQLDRAILPFEAIKSGLDCLKEELPEKEHEKFKTFKTYLEKGFSKKSKGKNHKHRIN